MTKELSKEAREALEKFYKTYEADKLETDLQCVEAVGYLKCMREIYPEVEEIVENHISLLLLLVLTNS